MSMNQKHDLRYSFDLQHKSDLSDKFMKLCQTKQIYFRE
jgi:hypothetical protein